GQRDGTRGVTASGATDGKTFSEKPRGADTTQMGPGASARTLISASGPAPAVPTAAQQIANGAIVSCGGGMALAVDQLAAGPGGLTGSGGGCGGGGLGGGRAQPTPGGRSRGAPPRPERPPPNPRHRPKPYCLLPLY